MLRHACAVPLYCTCIEWYGKCMNFARYTLGGIVCMYGHLNSEVARGLVLQLGLVLGTGNKCFIPFFFHYLKECQTSLSCSPILEIPCPLVL